ncbi:ornithine carbamoyltransferase [Paenibacillus aquistagni]|uniref:Ornithine carbamoyltransferase n=1 Tax=Paenibacillus aquistagni TaxID=1852522 RepID=A0A1X7KXR3_9BACL|nr:ornithine carbamoyltransferase [Paenibacillus aquistagni]SMG46408.1 ornithine carbamoyltransferase [Paenibacillus aquistagni]
MTLTQIDLRGRDFVALADYTQEELYTLLKVAGSLKEKQKAGNPEQPLKGKTLGMIFEKSSTRTRVSFEVGMYQLGGQALFLSKNDIQIGRGETIEDTAQVLSRYVDGIMIRTYAHRTVIDLARAATVPVINGLSDLNHPCQALADYMTVLEKKGRLEGLKIAYIGDGNNMAHSLMMGGAKFGMNVAIATPEGYEVDADVAKQSQEFAEQHGASITLTHDPKEAAADADVIYTDVWASMGFEEEQQQREKAFQSFQVNEELAKYAKNDYLFMHCLPAHRGEEVSAGVIDGENSIIFDQAENRLHAQKAIMALTMSS